MGREAGTQRLSRLIEIYLRIATMPRRWTRAELADLYELSPRQLQKDLDELRHRLNPSLRRTRAGYYFERQPVLSPLTYSLPEALVLLRAARAGAAVRGVDAAELAAAVARLEAVLPAELRPLLAAPAVAESPPASWRAEMLRVLELALARRRRVRLTYAAASRAGEVRERFFEPYAVEPYLRSWHTIGYCHLRQAIRTFKIDRIIGVTPTDEPYTIPADFNAAVYLGGGETWGLMVGGAGEPEAVTLRFSPLAGRWVREEQWHPSQQVEEEPDGHVRLRLRIAITPEFRHWVFHYGREVTVLEPATLRAWVAEEARAVLAGLGEET